MASFADVTANNPPHFIQRRSAIIEEMDKARTDSNISDAQKHKKLAELMNEWQDLKQEEKKIQQATVEKCIAAALLGREVVKSIDSYDKISLKDLIAILGKGMSLTEAITGQSMGILRARSQALVTEIRNDPLWNEVVDESLAEMKNIREEICKCAQTQALIVGVGKMTVSIIKTAV